MEVFLFFGAALLLAVVLKVIFTPRSAKKVVMSSNPIDGIRFGGVMGFMLGDSYEFCLSRFKHLDIAIDYQDKTGDNSMIMGWGKISTTTLMRFALYLSKRNFLLSL